MLYWHHYSMICICQLVGITMRWCLRCRWNELRTVFFYIDWSQRCRVTTLADILELRFFYSNPFSWDTWRNYNITFMSVNKSTLGRITPLGRPRSVQGRHGMPFLESKGPNDLARQDLWTHFSIPAVRIHRCIFGANLVILAQTHYKLSRGQVKYPRILCQNDDIF